MQGSLANEFRPVQRRHRARPPVGASSLTVSGAPRGRGFAGGCELVGLGCREVQRWRRAAAASGGTVLGRRRGTRSRRKRTSTSRPHPRRRSSTAHRGTAPQAGLAHRRRSGRRRVVRAHGAHAVRSELRPVRPAGRARRRERGRTGGRVDVLRHDDEDGWIWLRRRGGGTRAPRQARNLSAVMSAMAPDQRRAHARCSRHGRTVYVRAATRATVGLSPAPRGRRARSHPSSIHRRGPRRRSTSTARRSCQPRGASAAQSACTLRRHGASGIFQFRSSVIVVEVLRSIVGSGSLQIKIDRDPERPCFETTIASWPASIFPAETAPERVVFAAEYWRLQSFAVCSIG